ncbi:restriction endonuclease subunit S [Xanthomonas euvesicatoria]|uniref:restriction endonuclease subunit S n=1 Tax=Xanthomonas euvesicatoria TaxID=456327 RepID=UPI001C48F948|nr:restriction endonuclease subunit S [Xanthomonas euvesicatoria]MBV6795709.1 restriction endonuclease subunit S [Xanthomonas campestris pv. daturae]
MNVQQFLAQFGLIANAPDGVSRLRELVLQLAVQGRLIVPAVTDQSSSILLSQVRKVRSQLTADKKLPREKPYPSISKAGRIEDVPQHWQWAHFGEVWHLLSGRDLAPHQYNDSRTGVPYITGASNIDNGLIDVNRWTTEPVVISRIGDLLITCKGTIGKTAFNNIGDAHIARQIMAIRDFSGQLEPRFLKIWLDGFVGELVKKSKSMIPGFSREDLIFAAYPVFPREEQLSIVAKVDELMALCDHLEQQQRERCELQNVLQQSTLQALASAESLSELRASWQRLQSNFGLLFDGPEYVRQLRETILKLAVRGELTDKSRADISAEQQLDIIRKISAAKSGQGWRRAAVTYNIVTEQEVGRRLPDGWASARLGELVRVLNGRAYSKSELLDRGTPVLRVGNLFTSKDWYYSNLKLEDDKYCDKGDLLYAWSASFGPFIWDGPKAIYHYHIWKLDPFSEKELSKDYLYLVLQDRTAAIKASGRGLAMVHMTKASMEQLPLVLPPVSEQLRIVARVSDLMRLCEQLEEQLQASKKASSEFASAAVAALTGTAIEYFEETPMKAPQTELIASLRLATPPSRRLKLRWLQSWPVKKARWRRETSGNASAVRLTPFTLN